MIRLSPLPLLSSAVLLAAAALAIALVFQHGFGYAPCKLCLWQRWPYYIGIPIGTVAILLGGAKSRAGFLAVGVFILIFLFSMAFGGYHAGVEWGFWAGPTDCAATVTASPSTVLDLRKSLETARIVRCDAASLRILGLSFAGWNAVGSAIIAVLAGASLAAARR